MLSGDWIPVGLPDRARVALPGLQLVSLAAQPKRRSGRSPYPISAVGKDWRAIPYGQPLRNQQMHVLNQEMTRADLGTGQIYIAGIGARARVLAG